MSCMSELEIITELETYNIEFNPFLSIDKLKTLLKIQKIKYIINEIQKTGHKSKRFDRIINLNKEL